MSALLLGYTDPFERVPLRSFPQVVRDLDYDDEFGECSLRDNFGGTQMDQLDGHCVVSLEWDHPHNPFGRVVGCLVVIDAPGAAWREEETGDWATCIVFLPTQYSWRAAWRIARLLDGSHRNRPALIDHQTATAIAGMFYGPKTRVAWKLV